MEPKPEKQERKKWKITLFGGFLVFFALLGLVYCYLAFAPTGYNRFAKQNADALEKANAALGSMGKTPGRGSKPPESARSNAVRQEKKDLFQEFEVFSDPFQGKHQYIMNFWEILFGRQVIMVQQTDTYTFSNRELGMEDLLAEFSASRTSVRERVLRTARLRASDPYLIMHSLKAQITQENLSVWRASLQAALDQLEENLLDAPPETPGFERIPREWVGGSGGFMMLGRLLVLRAAIRGESDKAARLLENYLEGVRILHLGLFPEGQGKLPGVRSLILALGEVESFPEEGFLRARSILDRARLGEEELAAFRAANSLREAEQMHILLSEGFRIVFRGVWDVFLTRVPAKILSASASSVLRPVLRRRGDRLALAWARGDPVAVRAAEEEWLSIQRIGGKAVRYDHRLMPLGFDRLLRIPSGKDAFLARLKRLEANARSCGAYFNDEIDLTLLVLAAAHFRHETGRYPDSLEDLTPRYLDPRYAGDSFPNPGENKVHPAMTPSLLAVYKLPAFQAPQSHIPFMGITDPEAEPYRKACNQYMRKYKNYPDSPEALRPFAASDSDMEDFRKRFTPVGEKPVFCLFRLDASHKNLYDEFGRYKYDLVDGYHQLGEVTEEERKDLERRLNAPLEAVEVKFCWPEEPLISEELMELLK